MGSIVSLEKKIARCRKCPRLVEWRESVAVQKTKRYRDEKYWGKAVPGFGDPHASLLIVGLAPAAHGANRTGRMFTGDKSGDWLYKALHAYGFSNQPESTHKQDGLELAGAYIGAICHCAPPENKPQKDEIENCAPYLRENLKTLNHLRGILCLGKISFDHTLSVLRGENRAVWNKRTAFGHGKKIAFEGGLTVWGWYHPSQQNTFTGRLTEPMFHSVFSDIRASLKL